MRSSSTADVTSSPDDEKYVLLASVVVAAMERQGVLKKQDQAEKFGLDRTHYADLRAGRKTPSLPVALRIGRVAKKPVEKIIGRAA